ncbi:aa3-type cytochrome c oxidase subunit IV [Devosia salina]|uniref:Aa3-type cytochrome c oxidase subunit IV n=1 Tax=Devosia salina TaxID=2860336 RepID=A0ABX8WH96_9HYPH|nr:aa3-type cytochrome c oxidase subunit IV [Devosia salina]QYO76087.1 aa3-type cytochrome c oxidase subunit IV [Devosia salina]
MSEQQKSPDPLIPPGPVEAPGMDYPAHVRTYNGFMNLLKWFVIHIAILLAGLYFVVLAGDPYAGGVLILAAIGALVYGLLNNPGIRQDARAATTGGKIAE